MSSLRPRFADRAARPLTVALLAFQAFFLNVLLPGHTRGAITTDGKHTPAVRCCCGGGRPIDGDAKHHQVPSQRDRDHCALCQFAAGLTSDPGVRLAIAKLGLVDRQPVLPLMPWVARDLIPTYLACGPPAASV